MPISETENEVFWRQASKDEKMSFPVRLELTKLQADNHSLLKSHTKDLEKASPLVQATAHCLQVLAQHMHLSRSCL